MSFYQKLIEAEKFKKDTEICWEKKSEKKSRKNVYFFSKKFLKLPAMPAKTKGEFTIEPWYSHKKTAPKYIKVCKFTRNTAKLQYL